jgi:hypothetical protein
MHWMKVKLPDNFQMREHSWPCRFHIKDERKSDKILRQDFHVLLQKMMFEF